MIRIKITSSVNKNILKMPWYPKNTVYGQTDLLKYPYYCYVLITTYQQSRWYEEVHW